jgi:hypothetical protein
VQVRGDGKAARLTPGEGSSRIQPVAEGEARFPGTLLGTYRVELCADPDCAAVTATWDRVEVKAGRATVVDRAR